MVFPMILIIVGLALSNIKIFFEASKRPLSPDIFPSPNHLFYNSEAPLGGDVE